MKAIHFPTRGEVSFGELPDPVAGEGEVVVKVMTSGICHTDFEVLNANYGTSAFPVVPGHEYAGVVAEIGSGVSGISLGEHVAVDPNIECGTCRACTRGWAHLCEKLGAYGVTQNGGFAEFSVVNASALQPIGTMNFNDAALAEPMGCVLNGVEAVHDPVMENALVFGAGPMGLLMAIALQSRGVADITFVDLDETRLELAESFSFHGAMAGSGELDQFHHGADLAVEATGVPAVAAKLTDYIANGGKGLYFGVCPATAKIEVSPFEVFRRQLTLAGSHSLNHNIPQALQTIADYGPDIARVVSHKMPLQDVASVLAAKPPRGSLKIQAVFD
ncbi:MAG TPA: alcohol dehydrogenase catalytic domain-containing protein [Afifellaceae bacterium]|nr:alcohol dehydrogenase catalytic domain-containing protein [Afifellaceae bacterium]